MACMNGALAYAEAELGVHQVWQNAGQVSTDIEAWYKTLSDLEAGVRRINREIEERKNELLLHLLTQKFESQAAFDRAYKGTVAGDEGLNQLERQLLAEMAQRDSIHNQIKASENNLKAYNARMVELGGYFQYLAALKLAQVNAAQAKADAAKAAEDAAKIW